MQTGKFLFTDMSNNTNNLLEAILIKNTRANYKAEQNIAIAQLHGGAEVHLLRAASLRDISPAGLRPTTSPFPLLVCVFLKDLAAQFRPRLLVRKHQLPPSATSTHSTGALI